MGVTPILGLAEDPMPGEFENTQDLLTVEESVTAK